MGAKENKKPTKSINIIEENTRKNNENLNKSPQKCHILNNKHANTCSPSKVPKSTCEIVKTDKSPSSKQETISKTAQKLSPNPQKCIKAPLKQTQNILNNQPSHIVKKIKTEETKLLPSSQEQINKVENIKTEIDEASLKTPNLSDQSLSIPTAFSLPDRSFIASSKAQNDEVHRSIPGTCDLPFAERAQGSCRKRYSSLRCALDDGIRPPVSRRNARERNRVKQVSLGFNILRQHIPNLSNKKKLSKVETLRGAVDYIKSLQNLLQETNPPQHGDFQQIQPQNQAPGCFNHTRVLSTSASLPSVHQPDPFSQLTSFTVVPSHSVPQVKIEKSPDASSLYTQGSSLSHGKLPRCAVLPHSALSSQQRQMQNSCSSPLDPHVLRIPRVEGGGFPGMPPHTSGLCISSPNLNNHHLTSMISSSSSIEESPAATSHAISATIYQSLPSPVSTGILQTSSITPGSLQTFVSPTAGGYFQAIPSLSQQVLGLPDISSSVLGSIPVTPPDENQLLRELTPKDSSEIDLIEALDWWQQTA